MFPVLLDMCLGGELLAHVIAPLFDSLKLCCLTLFCLPPQAQKISDDLMQKISTQNRRALDLVAAKCYYYHARVYEFLDKLDVVRRYQWPRVLLAALGVSSMVRHFTELWTCRGPRPGRRQGPSRKWGWRLTCPELWEGLRG